jgi:serine-type D-Ala-D-Ala carboxypeptidase (penicillin-binding protein 5/6)
MLSRIALVLVCLVIGLRPLAAEAFETAARAAIMIDQRSGDVLFAKNPDERLPPASMSKLMTAFMVFDRLEEGSLSLDDELPVSEKAWRTGGSKMFVEVGDRVRVEDLLRGIIIQSGNDACVVVAEGLAGSEEAFAARMTERAQEIGLTNSSFKNASGLDDPEHYMSVRDLAVLAQQMIMRFPELMHFYAEPEFTYSDIRQYNRNPLLQAEVPGVDGLKTGHTSKAGYGLVATAEREGRRLVLVLSGLESERERRIEGERLLEYGFRDFEEYRLYPVGTVVSEARVWLGEAQSVPLVADETVAVTLSRDARPSLVVKLRYDEPVLAPIATGQRLGEIEIAADGIEPRIVPLYAGAEVGRAGAFGRLTGVMGYLVWGDS